MTRSLCTVSISLRAKKDDLADSFLQGIWYLQEYKMINNLEK